MKDRIQEILMESDLTIAAFILGWGLIFWGIVAAFMAPADLFTFAGTMRLGPSLFWVLNYILVGMGYIWVSYKRFPSFSSLMIGGYSCLVWTWIAAIRGSSNFTSGVTLNAVVIVMGVLLVQRSSRPACRGV